MNGAYLDLIANAGKAAITHIALFDGGAEISGGSPAYARKAVTWTGPTAGDGLIRPNADLDFDIPAGADVTGWRGFTALTGGTDYDGETLTTESFAAQGVYTLLAAATGIDHDAV
jgi:hypothetical protein